MVVVFMEREAFVAPGQAAPAAADPMACIVALQSGAPAAAPRDAVFYNAWHHHDAACCQQAAMIAVRFRAPWARRGGQLRWAPSPTSHQPASRYAAMQHGATMSVQNPLRPTGTRHTESLAEQAPPGHWRCLGVRTDALRKKQLATPGGGME